MSPFETWSDMSYRQAIDSGFLFREVIRVKKELLKTDDNELRERLKSLTRVLSEAQRLNKALRLGCASEKLVSLLNEWNLADEDRLILGFEALHAYAVMAGTRIKKSPSTIFNWHEHRAMEDLLRKAIDAGALAPNTTDQVVFTRAGNMGVMHVLGPLSFLAFKRWMSSRPERSALQVEQDHQQIDVVERLIAADLLSATFDTY